MSSASCNKAKPLSTLCPPIHCPPIHGRFRAPPSSQNTPENLPHPLTLTLGNKTFLLGILKGEGYTDPLSAAFGWTFLLRLMGVALAEEFVSRLV